MITGSQNHGTSDSVAHSSKNKTRPNTAKESKRIRFDDESGQYCYTTPEGQTVISNKIGVQPSKFTSNFTGFYNHQIRKEKASKDKLLMYKHSGIRFEKRKGYICPRGRKFQGYTQFPYRMTDTLPVHISDTQTFAQAKAQRENQPTDDKIIVKSHSISLFGTLNSKSENKKQSIKKQNSAQVNHKHQKSITLDFKRHRSILKTSESECSQKGNRTQLSKTTLSQPPMKYKSKCPNLKKNIKRQNYNLSSANFTSGYSTALNCSSPEKDRFQSQILKYAKKTYGMADNSGSEQEACPSTNKCFSVAKCIENVPTSNNSTTFASNCGLETQSQIPFHRSLVNLVSWKTKSKLRHMKPNESCYSASCHPSSYVQSADSFLSSFSKKEANANMMIGIQNHSLQLKMQSIEQQQVKEQHSKLMSLKQKQQREREEQQRLQKMAETSKRRPNLIKQSSKATKK